MNDLTQQQTQVRFQALPPRLRDTLSDSRTFEKIAVVGKKYDLTKVDIGLLAQDTGTLMMGFLKPNEFIAAIMEDLAIPRDKAMYIAQDLNREIFNDVKDLLKDIGTTDIKKSEVSGASVPSPIQIAERAVPPSSGAKAPDQPAGASLLAGGPIRSDWAWHGKKNETTGQIEFKREEKKPEFTLPLTTGAGAPHVVSIFEQKLGGAFTVKSTPPPPDYSEKVPETSPQPVPKMLPPAVTGNMPAKSGAASEMPKAPLHIPLKPKQVNV